MPTGICPECDEEVYVEPDADTSDTVECDECGTRLMIVGLDPVELDVATDEDEEDLDDYDDFDEFDYDDDDQF
jgi:lysine biosynthesis protein LysW